MFEHTNSEVNFLFAASQASCRDPVLSQVVKAVSREEESEQQPYSHKAAELSLEQGCLLWSSMTVIPHVPRVTQDRQYRVSPTTGGRRIPKPKRTERRPWHRGTLPDIRPAIPGLPEHRREEDPKAQKDRAASVAPRDSSRDGYPMVQSDKLTEHGVILEDLVCYYKEIYRNESLKKPDEEYLYGSRK
ncbi:hypothetical protein MRX96_011400 [Rhipicephalus microplus]